MTDPTAIRQNASLVLVNGKIVTMDADDTVASALAIDGAYISAVGTGAAIAPLISGTTDVVDLGGRTAMPGLIDGHAHMDREGLKEALPAMAGLGSIRDVQSRIAALAAQRRPGEWIVTMPLGEPPEFAGMPQGLKEGRFPTRAELDEAAPHNPVFVKPAWGYWNYSLPIVSLANSAALAAAGITRETVSPAPSLEIERDAHGEPTGIFREKNVMPIVEFTLMAAAPSFDLPTRTMALARSMEIYNGYGTTGVFEGHGVAADVISAYQRLHERKAASVRATLMFSPAWKRPAEAEVTEMIASWARWLARKGLGDEWLRVQGLFGEIDASPEVALRARALPQTGWSGFHYNAALPAEVYRVLLREAARNEIRVCAIAPTALAVFAEIDRDVSIAGQRWVLGHITALSGDDVARVRDLGLCVTTHTNSYIWRNGAALRARIGAERENDIVPLQRLLEANVPVSLATDNVPPSLWHPIWHAVARQGRSGEPIGPDQALTRAQALRCATVGGATLCWEEERRGSLERGKVADVVVLSQDPLGCDLAQLPATRAEMAIVGGRIVHGA